MRLFPACQRVYLTVIAPKVGFRRQLPDLWSERGALPRQPPLALDRNIRGLEGVGAIQRAGMEPGRAEVPQGAEEAPREPLERLERQGWQEPREREPGRDTSHANPLPLELHCP